MLPRQSVFGNSISAPVTESVTPVAERKKCLKFLSARSAADIPHEIHSITRKTPANRSFESRPESAENSPKLSRFTPKSIAHMRLNQLNPVKILLAISLVLFAASLGFQCYYRVGESPDWSFRTENGPVGFLLLMIGWMGLLTHEYAWLANPCYAIAMLIVYFAFEGLTKPRKSGTDPDFDFLASLVFAIIFSIAATLLSLSFMLQSWTYAGPGAVGMTHQIAGYSLGYYLWVGAILTQLTVLTAEIYHRIRVRSMQSQKCDQATQVVSSDNSQGGGVK